MIAKEIIEKYLRDNGYDGLYYDGCGCSFEELLECEEYCGQCKPGYKIPCDPETCWNGGECGFHIGPKKDKS
jgi:hypothetical protein